MLKKILFLTGIYLFVSCSSQKESYMLLNDILNDGFIYESNDTKIEIISKSIDTILISDKNYATRKIANYSLDLDSINYRNSFYQGYKVFWLDSKQKISLSQTEIGFLREQMDDNEFFMQNKKVNSRNRIVINSDSIYDSNYRYSYQKTGKLFPIYSFSKPVFNKEKNICLIGFYLSTNNKSYNSSNSKQNLLFVKKVNNKWSVVGFEKDIGSSY